MYGFVCPIYGTVEHRKFLSLPIYASSLLLFPACSPVGAQASAGSGGPSQDKAGPGDQLQGEDKAWRSGCTSCLSVCTFIAARSLPRPSLILCCSDGIPDRARSPSIPLVPALPPFCLPWPRRTDDSSSSY